MDIKNTLKENSLNRYTGASIYREPNTIKQLKKAKNLKNIAEIFQEFRNQLKQKLKIKEILYIGKLLSQDCQFVLYL